MYCLQWLLPLLLIPRPMNPFMLNNYSMFMTLYLASFFLERRPCTICTVVFVAAVFLICYSGLGNCLFFSECSTQHWFLGGKSPECCLKTAYHSEYRKQLMERRSNNTYLLEKLRDNVVIYKIKTSRKQTRSHKIREKTLKTFDVFQ